MGSVRVVGDASNVVLVGNGADNCSVGTLLELVMTWDGSSGVALLLGLVNFPAGFFIRTGRGSEVDIFKYVQRAVMTRKNIYSVL